MKKLFTLTLVLIFSLNLFSQSNSGAILGDWYNQEKDAIINIYEEGGKYHGKITWMLNPIDENRKPKTDPLNPDESLRSRARMGMIIMYNFVFEGDIQKLDYLTDLDKFILLSYIFCCIPTFISIGFSRFILKTQKLQKRVTVINSHIRRWGGLIYLIVSFQIFYSVN